MIPFQFSISEALGRKSRFAAARANAKVWHWVVTRRPTVMAIKLECGPVAYFISHAVQIPSIRRLPAISESRHVSIQGVYRMSTAYNRPIGKDGRRDTFWVPRSIVVAVSLVGLLLHASTGAEYARPVSRSSYANADEQSAPKDTAAAWVDTAKVHRLYMEGDFDNAIALLEGNLKDSSRYRHEDSVFIFKHLGVMYAAQYDTRERGTYFMHRLLQVEPTAKIMDMYASDMIYMIFKNIQEEYEQNRMQLAARYPERRGAVAMSPEAGSQGTSGSEPASKGSDRRAWIWTGAAVAAVAAGVGVYYLFASEPDPEVRSHAVTQ
jgi:hypothetical protein